MLLEISELKYELTHNLLILIKDQQEELILLLKLPHGLPVTIDEKE
jgi:hypothetical protein